MTGKAGRRKMNTTLLLGILDMLVIAGLLLLFSLFLLRRLE